MDEKLKTGTTTIGIKFKDGVLLAADKRATAGHFIANKAIKKVIPINDRIAITTAGSVSDLQLIMKYLRSEIELKELNLKRRVIAKEAANLLSLIVYYKIRELSPIMAVTHFLLAGIEDQGKIGLYDIYPDGSLTEVEDFVASGSGSELAYGYLESNYKKDLTREEAIELAKKALTSSLRRDSASGGGIDIAIIDEKGVEMIYTKIIDVQL